MTARKPSVYYVNSSAARPGAGTKEHPFRQISDAARIARAGDEVVVMPGIYREYVNPVNAGTEDQPVVYRSETPLGAVITGAEILTGWVPYEGNVWTVDKTWYQSTATVGYLITDLNLMLTGGDPADMVFLSKVE